MHGTRIDGYDEWPINPMASTRARGEHQMIRMQCRGAWRCLAGGWTASASGGAALCISANESRAGPAVQVCKCAVGESIVSAVFLRIMLRPGEISRTPSAVENNSVL